MLSIRWKQRGWHLSKKIKPRALYLGFRAATRVTEAANPVCSSISFYPCRVCDQLILPLLSCFYSSTPLSHFLMIILRFHYFNEKRVFDIPQKKSALSFVVYFDVILHFYVSRSCKQCVLYMSWVDCMAWMSDVICKDNMQFCVVGTKMIGWRHQQALYSYGRRLLLSRMLFKNM